MIIVEGMNFGDSKFEKETLETITRLRAEYNKTKDLEKGSELNAKCNQILAIAENYPELKASEHFLNLQKNLIIAKILKLSQVFPMVQKL